MVLCPTAPPEYPAKANSRAASVLLQAIDPNQMHDVAIIGAVLSLAAAVYAASEGLSVIVMDCRALAARRALPPASRIIWVSPPNYRHGADGPGL